MKKFFLVTAFINLIFINACSTETSTKPVNAANGSTANVNTNNINAANSNSFVADSNNTNLSAANNNISSMSKAVNRKLENVPTNYKEPGAVEAPGAPAPYNSTIKVTMNKQNQFLEIREFKDDPLVSKIERTQESKKINVFLKNGKVVALPFEKDSLFMGASPNEILIAAGVVVPKPKTADGDQKNIPNAKKQ